MSELEKITKKIEPVAKKYNLYPVNQESIIWSEFENNMNMAPAT